MKICGRGCNSPSRYCQSFPCYSGNNEQIWLSIYDSGLLVSHIIGDVIAAMFEWGVRNVSFL